MVVTRFAPSPTGFLHVGGARTAIFNWLYAKANGGKFLLRVEDTDKARNSPEAVAAIHESLAWLGIDSDESPVYQSHRSDRHVEVAMQLLHQQDAYLDQGAIRIKGIKGKQDIHDLVQGKVSWAQDIDDFVLLRADGTPTYMLAVVVDDYDMGVTHVIRGDDHLNNAFRQMVIYKAMGWNIPTYAHIPLIHSEEGKKYSKRDGAVGVMDFAEKGILPDALFNYLIRLGWGHGDDEIISRQQAIDWFDIVDVRKSPSRFGMKKLLSINSHYINTMDDYDLAKAISDRYSAAPEKIIGLIPLIKDRAKTLIDAYDLAHPMFVSPNIEGGIDIDAGLIVALKDVAEWQTDDLEKLFRDYSTAMDIGLGTLVAPVRTALTGSKHSLPIWALMSALGREESFGRLSAD